LGFADIHIHSVHSHDGTSSIPAILKYVADFTNLDVIAITDHDKIGGLKEAMALGPKYGIDVIPGCEVSTAQGHLLALFIDGPLPAGRSLVETVKRVAAMGGLCVVPHPEAPGISGLRAAVVRAALADPQVARTLVGVETFNGGLFLPHTNAVAEELGRSLGLARVGSSDAHVLTSIGHGMTGFEGSSAAELRAALVSHATTPVIHPNMEGASVLRRWFPQFCLRKMGWVAWTAAPENPIRYTRMPQLR
jgi:predicted metal-dependent phosphoesterase TrpH